MKHILLFLAAASLAIAQSFPVKTNAGGAVTEPANLLISGALGGTGVANTGKTVTLGGNLTTSGAFGLVLTLTGNTTVTLPTSGTLSTLAGVEVFTNKSINLANNTLTATSAQVATSVTDETGTGNLVFSTSPTLVTPNIGAATGTSVNLSGNGTFGGNLTVSGTSALNGTVNTNGAKAVNVTPTMTPLSGNLYGLYVQPTINSGASAGGTVSGLTVAATNSGTSNVTNIAGIEFIGGNGAASGSMQDLKAFRSSPVNLSTGQIVNLYQFYATNAYNPSGIINTQYGLYVDALTSATTNYAIYTAGTAPSVLGGNLTVSGTGTSTFSSNLNVNKSTAVVDIGDGTTGPNFRLVSSVTGDANAYLQIGKSSADTNANLIISRYSTGSTAINSASIYATTTLLSGNLTVSGTGNNQIGGSGAKIGLGTAPNASAGTYIKNSSGYTLLVDTGRTDAGTTGIFLRDNAGSVRGWVGFDPTGTTLQISGNGGGTAIGDNLTVSGSIVNQNGVIQSTLAAGALISSLSTNNNAVHGFQISGSGTGSRDWRLEQGRAGANSFSISNATGGITTPLIVNGATNNILIGCSSTSSDSGNGKLQLATGAADKTSGIGFSSDTSLYRYQGGGIALDHLGGSLPALSFLTNGAIRFSVYANGTTGTLETSNGSIQLATSGAIALTLDASQNAIFSATTDSTSTSTGALQVSGGVGIAKTLTTTGRILTTTVKTANYTVATTDHVVVCNSASTFTVTLIAASTNTGRHFIVKNKGAGTVTVDATSLGQIDGVNTITLGQYQSTTLVSDGTTWNRI